MTLVPPLALSALVAASLVALRLAVSTARSAAITARLTGNSGTRTGTGTKTIDHSCGSRLLRPPAPVERALRAAAIDAPPAVAWSLWVAAVVAVPSVLVVAGGVALAIVGAVALLAAPAAVLVTWRFRAAWRFEAALPEVLESIARALRSGASLLQALDEVAATAPTEAGCQFGGVAERARAGSSLVEALEEVAARRPLPGVRLAVAALALGVETGGAQARAIDGVAATLRDRLNVAAEVQALSSQARASAVVIALAPLGFGAFAVAADRRTGEFLLNSGLGIAFLVAGLVLDAAGWLWMQRVSRVQP